MVALACGLMLSACTQRSEAPSDEDIQRNNRGVALMGQYRNDEAFEVFSGLAERHPGWLDVRVNAAIAALNRQQEGDELLALAIVRKVLDEAPTHVRARYVSGLMQLYLGEPEAALADFLHVLERAPQDAHAAYFAGQAAAQAGRPDAAAGHYRRAIELDPFLRSAYYGAALVLRQLGDAAQARALLSDYQRFENNPRAHLAEFRYTRMGPLAEAKAVGTAARRTLARAPDGPLFAPAEEFAQTDIIPVSLTTVDLDDDGLQDLFAAGGDGRQNAVFLGATRGFSHAPAHPLAAVDGVSAAAWGDFDNDGAVDAYLCRGGGNLLLNAGAAEAAGADDVADVHRCVDVAVFDADHDGDLDLFVVNGDGPNELFNNNLNGTWRRLSGETEVELSGGARASRALLAVDLQADRVVDLVVLHAQPPHQVWINDRLWRYQPANGFDQFTASSLVAVSAADFDADGNVALVTVDRAGILQLWQPDAGGSWQPRTVIGMDIPEPATAALAVMDFSGDGRPEILVHHSAGFHVIRAPDTDGAASVLFEESVSLAALVPVLLDAARGPSLVGAIADGDRARLVLWAAGSGRQPFTAVAPTGRSERGDGMRSNASGIGTGLTVRAGRNWAITDTYDRHSAPGQSLQPVAIGLGGRDRADFIQLHWTDGVLQTEMDVAAGEVHRIAEIQRQLASCPVLFAWNGERHEFVSDLLGVAGIGFLLEPGVYSNPRPWEYFMFPAGSIVPRDGRYAIKITEPMEEVAYLDEARLHIHDLPPGWAMTLDERMHTGGGPAPTGAAVFYRPDRVLRPVRAADSHGRDVAAELEAADNDPAPPGARHPHFLGRLAAEHVLTLEFDAVINPPGSRPVLVANGWVEYPYSQTLFSAWQAGAEYRPPSLEAFAGGQWRMVYERFGYPAGMPREMSLPLADLPAGTTALRLSGNWEVYWDMIAVVNAEPAPAGSAVHVLEVADARVAKTGFARRDTLAYRRPYYDYADRSPFWDTQYPAGFYAALGAVDPLVAATDDAFAVIGPGEEIHMEFMAPAPPADGASRHVVLEVRGYAKDMDLYTRDGDTVGPLPRTPGVSDDGTRDRLHGRFLTRFQKGQ